MIFHGGTGHRGGERGVLYDIVPHREACFPLNRRGPSPCHVDWVDSLPATAFTGDVVLDCYSHVTIDHASLPRRSVVPAPRMSLPPRAPVPLRELDDQGTVFFFLAVTTAGGRVRSFLYRENLDSAQGGWA